MPNHVTDGDKVVNKKLDFFRKSRSNFDLVVLDFFIEYVYLKCKAKT